MFRYFRKPFCEVFDFLSATHAEAQAWVWWKSDSFDWFLLSVTPQTPLSTSPERFRILWLWMFELSLILFSCFPAPTLPFLLVLIGIRHQLSRLIWLFFFLLSLSNLFLPVWFFRSLISCPLSSNSSLHCFNIYSFQLGFFSFVYDVFHFSPNEILLIYSFHTFCIFWHSHILTLTIITIIFIVLFLLMYILLIIITIIICTVFGHLLYKSSHFSHHSLNGLSPATTSSCSHSSSPSPLSILLGGPAFLPGFSRPQCENWRWRGRRWRRDNHWSRPQSVFLVTNCRASLSSC